MNISVVKNVILTVGLFFLPLVGGEGLPLLQESKKQNFKSNIQDMKDDILENWNFFPYLQMEFFLPGIGVCMRSQGKGAKLEINFKAASFAGFVNFYSTSVSVIYAKGALYSGLGAGGSARNDFHGSYGRTATEFSLLCSVFIGFEDEDGFYDFGADAVKSDGDGFPFQDVPLIVTPTFRYGWKF